MIYFDNAATTKVNPVVSEWIKDNIDELWLNPSSAYAYETKKLIEDARQSILYHIGANEDDHIIFTSGGSEANSMLSLIGGVVTTPIEHESILKQTWRDICRVDAEGFVKLPMDFGYGQEYLSVKLADKTFILSVQLANNEIGTIQDLRQIREIYPESIIHTDAVQAIGHIPVNVKVLGIDMLSASAHKFGGPKGVGFLYANKKAYERIRPIIYGTQEDGRRGSTYNTLGIVGMAKALEFVYDNMIINTQKTIEIRDALKEQLDQIPCASLNGPADLSKRLPGNLNYRFEGYRGEQIQEFLAERDIYVSTGSACNTGSGNPSHVLTAIGLSDTEADSSIRISVNENNTIDETLQFINNLKNGLLLLK